MQCLKRCETDPCCVRLNKVTLIYTKERPWRRIAVTSSFNKKSTDQLGNVVMVRGKGACLLSGVESWHLSKILNGRYKQRSGTHCSPPKNIQKNI
jgi:hypothetical protein